MINSVYRLLSDFSIGDKDICVNAAHSYYCSLKAYALTQSHTCHHLHAQPAGNSQHSLCILSTEHMGRAHCTCSTVQACAHYIHILSMLDATGKLHRTTDSLCPLAQWLGSSLAVRSNNAFENCSNDYDLFDGLSLCTVSGIRGSLVIICSSAWSLCTFLRSPSLYCSTFRGNHTVNLRPSRLSDCLDSSRTVHECRRLCLLLNLSVYKSADYYRLRDHPPNLEHASILVSKKMMVRKLGFADQY